MKTSHYLKKAGAVCMAAALYDFVKALDKATIE